MPIPSESIVGGKHVRIQVPGMKSPLLWDDLGTVHRTDISQWFSRVRVMQGAQILEIPQNSSIKNISLEGGASAASLYTALRGGVLKFSNDRRNTPLEFDGRGLVIPSGHTLMDELCYQNTVVRNDGENVPYKLISDICWRTDISGSRLNTEPMYLVHASYCHPDQVFFGKGLFTHTQFNLSAAPDFEHGLVIHRRIFLWENLLPVELPTNIFESSDLPLFITIALNEGGVIELSSK